MPDNVAMVSKHLLRRAPRSAAFLAAGFLLIAFPLLGQKTDVNINLYGTIPSSASGTAIDGTTGVPIEGAPPLHQSADPSLGFRMGVRHIFSPIFGLELNFGYNRATQHFTGVPSLPNGIGVVYSHAKPFTVDYVVSVPHTFFGVRPFALAGAGLISYNISSYSALPPGVPSLPARSKKVPVFEYGLGADFNPAFLPPFIALRLQYRGLVGHAPDYRLPYLATSSLINIAEPQIGLAFKF
ncbi:MAG: hypothetical protein ABI164_08550 [Acidobacteriaceae bacterium]